MLSLKTGELVIHVGVLYSGRAAGMLQLHQRKLAGLSRVGGWLAQDLLAQHPGSADLTHVNMLAERLMRGGQARQVLDLIRQAAATLCDSDGLPIELQVRRLRALSAGRKSFIREG